MPNWPATLPDVMRDPTHGQSVGVLRTEMAGGFARQVVMCSQEIKYVNARWVMSPAQYRTFMSFHRHTIGRGYEEFSVDLPFGNGLEASTAKFVNGAYKASYQQPHWVITGVLEVLEAPLMDEATFDFYADLGDDLDAIESAAEHLRRLVHSTLPSLF